MEHVNHMPPDSLLVYELAGSVAMLTASQPTMPVVQTALDLGFKSEEGKLVRPIANDEERADLIRKLIKLGALFIGGAGWSPAEVVARYKDGGRVLPPFREIVWRNPQAYEVIERS